MQINLHAQILTRAYCVYMFIRTLTTPTCPVEGATLSNLLCGYALASFALHYITSIRRRKLGFVSLMSKG